MARTVAFGIDAAKKRPRFRGPELPRQPVEHRAAREGEVEVVAGDQVGRKVIADAALERRHGDRRVDVVEGRHAPRMSLHEAAHGSPLGHVGPDHDGTSLGDLVSVAFETCEVVVEFEAAERGVDEVAGRAAVPGDISFEEQDVVAAGRIGPQQRPVGRRVSVPPGRRQAHAQDDEIAAHAPVPCGRSTPRRFSKASTSAPRRS